MSKKKHNKPDKKNRNVSNNTSTGSVNELESLLFPTVNTSDSNNNDSYNGSESDPAFIERINDGRNSHFSYSRTGRCHCNGYLWFLKELGIYKCGDCGAVYDKVILDPDIIDDDDDI